MNLLFDTAVWLSLSNATFEGNLAAVLVFEHEVAYKSQLSFSLDKVTDLVDYELGTGEAISKEHSFKSIQSFKKKRQRKRKKRQLKWPRRENIMSQS